MTKVIREKIGLLASIVFIFGLLSFTSRSNDDADTNGLGQSQSKTWFFNSDKELNRSSGPLLRIELENNMVSQYELMIKCGKDKQGQVNIPVSASSLTSGFVSGTKWRPSSISLKQDDGSNELEYHVCGIMDWKLFGLTLYSQVKEFKGTASIKK